MFCDLHTHSTASDGTTPPNELAALAQSVGLSAIALTDHDTTAGLTACQEACHQAGIQFVPGIELSADPAQALHASDINPPPRSTATLHILGLLIRHDAPSIADVHTRMLNARQQRNPKIIEKLNTLGVAIEYQEVLDLAEARNGRIITRPHIAQVLVDKGYADSIKDAFERYLGSQGAAYIPRQRLDAHDAIGAIHQAGGLAILAHPVQLRIADAVQLERFVAHLQTQGLDGIETRHSDHRPEQTRQFQTIADKLSLLTSGGSDFHGPSRPAALGSQRVPYEVYLRLYEAHQQRKTP